MIKASNSIIAQFVRFGIVGLTNTAVSYLVYLLFVLLGCHYLLANAFSFIAGVVNAFFWSNKYVFKKKPDEKRNVFCALLKTFISYGSTGLLLNSFLLYLLVEEYGVPSLFAQLFCLSVTVPLNFLLNKYWSFKTLKI